MHSRQLSLVCGLLFLGVPALAQEDRLVLPTGTIDHDATGVELSVQLDTSQDLLGLSLAFECDASVLLLQDVALGADLEAISPEWSSVSFDASSGEVLVAVIFDFTGPDLTNALSSGSGLEAARFTVDVVDPLASSTGLDFLPDGGTPLIRRSVLTTTLGESVVPTLVPGVLDLSTPGPGIVSVSGNSGPPGTRFDVIADNLDSPGLLVRVCGTPAAFTLGADGRTLTVTAPGCSEQLASVEVCTDAGCDSLPAGFVYSSTRAFVRGDVNLDLVLDLSDPVSILLHLFGGVLARCDDAADVDDSESLTITDALLLLGYLFQQGPPPSAPFPLADFDPSGVDLDCEG